MTKRVAEAFPPGEFVREELEARGWTQTDLAEIIGRPLTVVNEIANGKRGITPETALGLGEAFGTGAEFWMNLENLYQIWKAGNPPHDVRRKARIFEKAPVTEMIRRGWIQPTESVEVLERQILDFFEIKSLDQEPRYLPHAARKATSYEEVSPRQQAWLFRVRHLAKAVHAERFTPTRFANCLQQLEGCRHAAGDIRRAPSILASGGIRLVIVEPLSSTKIDGACLWLNRYSPVVAVSFRFNRIDWFWFVMMHELGHVKNRDGLSDRMMQLDTDLLSSARSDEDRPEIEREADRFAAEFLVDPQELDGFITRTKPFFYKEKIKEFAERIGVHPGIVVGQLQYRGAITYAHNREMLVKVREILTLSALTDGWGLPLAV